MEEQSLPSSTTISEINSESVSKEENSSIVPRKKRICLVGLAINDSSLNSAAQQFNVPLLKSNTGLEYLNDITYCTYFVLKYFEGPEYEALYKSAHRILGPTALLQLAEKKEPLPSISRPMYSQAMSGTIIVFTGFRKKDELTKLINVIHHMGGSIRKDMGSKVTHLVANCCSGEKYRYAVTFRVPIMSMNWVLTLWEKKDDVSVCSDNKDLLSTYKLKPFYGAKVCFFGFPQDEEGHMCEVLLQQGGECTEVDDPNCTHIVVDESNVSSSPNFKLSKAHVVKAEWFWTSVQNEGGADEKEYLFKDHIDAIVLPSPSTKSENRFVSTPTLTRSFRRKRKRLTETLFNLGQNAADSPALYKRRSSVSDTGHLSVSGSFLDCTASPDKQLLDDSVDAEANKEVIQKNLSARHQVFLELLQTESNYVGILSTITTLFKVPLEDLIGTTDELLNSTEVKIIFGNFPPIYEVHLKILLELKQCAAKWKEEISIGSIFLKYSSDLEKAYFPYINFFEKTKEVLDQCDQNKPRFHAFLKICQTKPECGRQSLKELLIKPVQRLPSISLLINDILKHTSKSNPDHSALVVSLNGIREVMTNINEDKRKTEGQLAMFDIFNDIENCPAQLVSSQRSFVSKCEVVELSEGLSGRGDHLVLFLFTDTLEICKKRSKAFNTLKSPGTINGLHTLKLQDPHRVKHYKHVKMIPLSSIKKVVDIRETPECHKVFALMVRSNVELKEKLYSFTITDEEISKIVYLKSLCRQTANTVCKADADSFFISLDSHQLEIDTSDIAIGTLSKAFKFASRTKMKVGRALSFKILP